MKFINKNNGTENCKLYVSSNATLDSILETLNGETSGNCFGPNDDMDDTTEAQYATENFDAFEEMSKQDENERIAHLADEWGLDEKELDYLR